MRELLSELRTTGAALILATTTVAYEEKSDILSAAWTPRISERNEALRALAEEFSLPIDDLYRVSLAIPMSDRSPDGIHYTATGFHALAESVVKSIKTAWEK